VECSDKRTEEEEEDVVSTITDKGERDM